MLQRNKNNHKRPILQNKKLINNDEVSKNLEFEFFNRPYRF